MESQGSSVINLASDNVNSMEKMCAVQEGTGAFASWDVTDHLETRLQCIQIGSKELLVSSVLCSTGCPTGVSETAEYAVKCYRIIYFCKDQGLRR